MFSYAVIMSVHKRVLPSGSVRWDARIRDASRRPRQKTFTTKREAVAWEQEQLSRVRGGKPVISAGKGVTLQQCWVVWSTRPGLARGTYERYKSTAKALTPLLSYPVTSINRDLVQEWYDQLITGRQWVSPTDPGVSVRTARSYLGHLSGTLRRAVEDGHLVTAPILPTASRDSSPAPVLPTSVPSDEAVLKVVSFLSTGGMGVDGVYYRPSPVLSDMVELLTFTGLRLGEACGLTIDDVDTTNRTLHVHGQLIGNDPSRQKAPLKTGTRGIRVIPYPPSADILMRGIIARAEVQRVKGGTPYLFRSSRGVPLSSQIASSLIRRVVKATGESWTPHALRHRYASKLLTGSDARSLVEVSHLLGHSSPSTTARVYAHMITGNTPGIVKAIDSDYRSVFGDPDSDGSLEVEGVDYEMVDGYRIEINPSTGSQ